MTIWDARSLAIKQLQQSQHESKGRIVFSTPSLDVDCILSFVLGVDRTYLISHNQEFLHSNDERDFFDLVTKRSTGFPVAYIVGVKEFFGFNFFVTPDVLIPKPDTELLVEKANVLIDSYVSSKSSDFLFADVCTGSGCIALSILKTFFNNSLKNKRNNNSITCHCVDISSAALDIAKKNAKALLDVQNQSSIQFYLGDLLDPLGSDNRYHAIISNPPYVPHEVVDELLRDGRSEPRIALDGDLGNESSFDGLFIIRKLIPQAFEKLVSGGHFLIETGEYNAFETASLMKDVGFNDVQTFEDLAGQPRVTTGVKP